MKEKFLYKFSLKEGIMGLFIIIVMYTLSRWTYFFLPPEYAEKAQMPTIEDILLVSVALIIVMIYKIIKEVKEIQKNLNKNTT